MSSFSLHKHKLKNKITKRNVQLRKVNVCGESVKLSNIFELQLEQDGMERTQIRFFIMKTKNLNMFLIIIDVTYFL